MQQHSPFQIPAWQLYGENSPFPDLLHIERIVDRAAGLDWQIAPHRHLHLHQIFLISEGIVRLTVDGESLQEKPPLIANIPRGHVHSFAFSAGTEGYVLTLPANEFPELFGQAAETRANLELPFVAPARDMAPLFATLVQLYRQGTLRRLRLRAAALTLCCAVAEARGEGNAKPSARDGRITRFEDLIRSHLAEGWHLADYASALGLSERHLRRLCLAATGLSAHAFLDATRLREACRLLAYTRMRAQEVGFALGFDDPAYFARVFRRGMGVSVTDYRKQLEAGPDALA